MRLGVVWRCGWIVPGEFLTPKSARLLQGQAGASALRSQVELGTLKIHGKTSINLASMSKGISDLPQNLAPYFSNGHLEGVLPKQIGIYNFIKSLSLIPFPESFPIGLPSACKHCAHR